jgi:hypothetical protein
MAKFRMLRSDMKSLTVDIADFVSLSLWEMAACVEVSGQCEQNHPRIGLEPESCS